MNLKKLAEADLLYLINTETDLKKLEAYEEEWIHRFSPIDISLDEHQEILDQIYKTWRDN